MQVNTVNNIDRFLKCNIVYNFQFFMWFSGCLLGRYGANCEHSGHCNGPYDIVAGICTSDCLDGWIGYRCEIG